MGKKWALLYFLLFLGTVSLNAQNHLSNGNFESFSVVPTNFSQWYYLYGGWNAANGCVPGSPNCGTPDFYHTAGYSVGPAASGNAYVGLFTNYTISSSALNYREYISAEMTPWLDSGEVYLVSFFVKAHKLYTHTTYSNNLGVHINRNFATQNSIEPMTGYEPQFHIEEVITHEDWVRYRFLFYADTVYRTITLGNFYADSNTIITPGGGPNNTSAYYLIDSIRVEPFNYNLQASGDTVVCAGAQVSLSASGDIDYMWARADEPEVIIDTASVITVRPDSTTTYLLYGTFDTVSLTVVVLPAPVFSIGADTSICPGDTLVLSIGNSDNPVVWSDGDTSQSIFITDSGAYSATVTGSNGCVYADQIMVTMTNCDTTGISDLQVYDVQVFPNPGSNGWFIEGNRAYDVELILYNSQGKLIYIGDLSALNGYQTFIEPDLGAGIYFLQVIVGNSSRVHTLLLVQ